MGTNSVVSRSLKFSALLCLGTATAAQAQTDPETPPGNEPPAQNRPAPTISAAVYERLAEARTCLDEGDPDCALELLGQLAGQRNLTAFDRANLFSLAAYAYFDLEDYAGATGAYEDLLALPRDELTPGIVERAMRNLASAYWNLDRLRDALATFDEWMALPSITPVGDDWYRKGMLHYQLAEYAESIAAVTKAIAWSAANGELGEESWYQLLAALYSELEDEDELIATLTLLSENWTRREHILQLAGHLSQADRQTHTLVLYEAAYHVGWLTTSSNLVNLATLHLQFDAPYKAARVLEEGLAAGRIESTERTWNLLGQAWQIAGHHRESIPAFERAAELADDGNADLRLARAYGLRHRWEDCAEAARRGFERGDLTSPDLAWIQLGHCEMSLGNWDEADAAFTRAERTERSRDTARRFLVHVNSLRNEQRINEEQLREAEEIRDNGRGIDLSLARGLMQRE